MFRSDTCKMILSPLDMECANVRILIGSAALFIFSVCLLIFCPQEVSRIYIYICFGVYILSTYLYFSYKKKNNYFDFDTIFILIYTILGFAYPVFLYNEEEPYSIAFSLSFDVKFIPLGVIYFVLGIQSYFFGGMIINRYSTSLPKIKDSELKFPVINNTILSIIVIFLCVVFVLSGGVQYYRSVYYLKEEMSEAGLIFQIMSLLHVFSIVAISTEFYNKCVDKSYKLNKLLVVALSSIIILMLYVGNRTLASQLALPFLGLYTMFFMDIGKLKILLFILAAILFMWVIQTFRTGLSIESAPEVKELISDLTIPTRSTYSGMEYIEQYGYTYGMNMSGGVIGVVPSLERILIQIFGLDSRSLGSAEILTDYSWGYRNGVGLGTNIIADLNMSFGLTGVLLFMFILGYFVNRHLDKAKKLNYYSIIIYACMMSYSVFLVRASYTHPTKLIIWSLMVGVLNKSLSQKLFNKSE